MAAHNQIRVLGYLLDNPQIENEGEPGEEKVYLTIRVRNRAVDGYPSSDFQDLIIFYDGANEYRNRDKIMDKLKSLIKYDLIDLRCTGQKGWNGIMFLSSIVLMELFHILMR